MVFFWLTWAEFVARYHKMPKLFGPSLSPQKGDRGSGRKLLLVGRTSGPEVPVLASHRVIELNRVRFLGKHCSVTNRSGENKSWKR